MANNNCGALDALLCGNWFPVIDESVVVVSAVAASKRQDAVVGLGLVYASGLSTLEAGDNWGSRNHYGCAGLIWYLGWC